jgi:hypothetical protein
MAPFSPSLSMTLLLNRRVELNLAERIGKPKSEGTMAKPTAGVNKPAAHPQGPAAAFNQGR